MADLEYNTKSIGFESSAAKEGCVYLVGAGPGDYRLITYKGMELFTEADVVLYDRLVNPSLLAFIPPEVEKIYVGKARGNHTLKQEQINELLIEKASQGKVVVRLKGGDPFVFGRGGEEALILEKAGIDYQIVPGISSIIAAATYAGIPITHRDYSSSFHVFTAHNPEGLSFERMARMKGTIILVMGLKKLGAITSSLIEHGYPAQKPAVVIYYGTTSNQVVVDGTVKTIVGKVSDEQISPPVLIVIGDVVKLRNSLQWYPPRGELAGKRIMVTRPREQKDEMGRMIENLGGEVLYCPTIEIKGPLINEEIRVSFSQIERYDWIFFTSANGVRYFFEIFRSQGLDIRDISDVKFAVIGPATKKKLSEYGIIADLIPDNYSTDSMVNEFIEKETSKLLLPRADIAGEEMRIRLEKAGHEVDNISIYKTIVPDIKKESFMQIFTERDVDIITFTSSSTVNYLQKILGKDIAILKDIPAACIGPVTADAARKLGFNVKGVAKEFTAEGLVEALNLI